MKKFLFLLLMTWAVFASAGQARYRVETAYLHDATENYSIADVAGMNFAPFADQLRLGLQKGNTWMRIRVVPDPDGASLAELETNTPLALVVGPYFLDDLEFFSFSLGRWHQQLGGALHSRNFKNCPIDLHCFELIGFKDDTRGYFLRVNTFRARTVSTEVMAAEQLQELSFKRMIGIVASFTLTTTLMLLALVFWVLERTRLIFAYVLFQASIVLTTGYTTGFFAYGSAWMPFEILNNMGNQLIVLRTVIAVALGWMILSPYKPSASYFRVIFSLIFACCLSAVLLEVEQAWLSAWLILMVILLLPIANIWGSMRPQIDMPTRKIFQASWGVFFAIVCFETLNAFALINGSGKAGITESNREMRVGGLIFGVMVVMMAVIHRKSKRKLQALQETQKLELNAEKTRLEQLQLQDQMGLIDMLTHELKTPLSTIKFAIASLQRTHVFMGESGTRIQNIDASLRRMDTLIEHVAASNKIERHDAHIEADKISAADFMNEVLQEYSNLEKLDLEIEEHTYFNAAPQFLNLIVDNLVANAFKYASDGHVNIKVLRLDSSTTSFQISNRVSDDNQPDEARLFERYYRHPNFQNLPGMGIGLSLVHSAAEKIGSTVHYHRQGQLVTFEVRFPL
jgi:signal transduction histidine kinase